MAKATNVMRSSIDRSTISEDAGLEYKRQGALRCLGFGVALLAVGGLAYASAGGAGGGGGGDSGGDAGFLFDIVFWLIFNLPFPLNLILIALIVIGVFYARRQVRSVSGLNSIPSVDRLPELLAGKANPLPASFLERNPGFAAESLLNKVRTAFPAIQQAWSNQDMAPVRRWISDGVWQRFNTQFAMMRLLGQRNVVANLRILRAFIDAVEEDGDFDIVHVGIHFSAEDDFVSEKFPQFDQRGPLETVEYWTFIRKAGVLEKDLYHSNLCPACGAELPVDMGEVARCASCHTVSTLGDYDWVLCEITQADDYVNQNRRLGKEGSLTRKIRDALRVGKDFSVQSIEDKASNAYLQILAARALQRPEGMRRFVGDAVFERLAQPGGESPWIYNRLYLNSVTAIDAYRADGKNHIVVAIKRTAQRVAIEGDNLRLIDRGRYANDEIIVLSRDEEAADTTKASLYAHACPACGAPVADTLDVKCAYCGEALNSTSREWIVSQLLAVSEYQQLAAKQKSVMATRVAADDLDSIFAVRDYVLNNVLMMIGIDGKISPEELDFAHELVRSLGYKEDKIAGLLDLARNRKLALRLPEKRKAATRVLAQMEKAANADQHITSEEQALLDDVRLRVEAIWGE